MTSTGSRLFVAMGLIALASACTAAPSAMPVSGESRPASPARRAHVIVKRVPTYVIPADDGVTVSEDVVVFASEKVEIDGLLYVKQGVSFAFFTPQFVLKGKIYGEGHPEQIRPVVRDQISACALQVLKGSSLDVGAGDALEFTSSRSLESCAVEIGQPVAMRAGIPGGKLLGAKNGMDGGFIDIGTQRAIHDTEATAEAAGETRHAYEPATVTLTASMRAADGGAGESVKDATTASGVATFASGNGGAGGDVTIVAGLLNQLGAAGDAPITAGNGAAGGTITYDGTKFNGTQSAPNGLSAVFQEGGGGAGGSVSIKTQKATQNVDVQQAGTGGAPGGFGSTGQAGGGMGYGSANGNGGSLTLALGEPGAAGSGTNHLGVTPIVAVYPPMQFLWGNGGSTQYPPSVTLAGGSGGSFTLKRPAGVTGNQFAIDGKLNVNLTNSFSGSNAIGGKCGVQGVNGGNAGNLHDGGLRQFVTTTESWFSGGNGSPGFPPGNGGDAGKDDEGATIGSPGVAGMSCQ